jgi:hypothetical protein
MFTFCGAAFKIPLLVPAGLKPSPLFIKGGLKGSYGAILVAGSLQPLCPAGPIAATLNQYLSPLVRFWMVCFDFVEIAT